MIIIIKCVGKGNRTIAFRELVIFYEAHCRSKGLNSYGRRDGHQHPHVAACADAMWFRDVRDEHVACFGRDFGIVLSQKCALALQDRDTQRRLFMRFYTSVFMLPVFQMFQIDLDQTFEKWVLKFAIRMVRVLQKNKLQTRKDIRHEKNGM